ncbi:hypothetical protein FAZ78_05085 [Cereibacter changlensis]|uniref:D-serine dehydratase-like domain-containing protein n=2 Tax=Cereibacter changlensis TaxID=402884 RepID=A0A4U0Z7S9_9RHOB|nr:hypothetical protein FAZ78_05085 [Cereibacter changlensis]
MEGVPYPDLIVRAVSQKHGQIGLRDGSAATLPNLPLGARIRILPIHACATVAMHPVFRTVDICPTISPSNAQTATGQLCRSFVQVDAPHEACEPSPPMP